jgi:hypothetical protein
MTKVMKTVEVPATQREVLDHYQCDLCSKTTTRSGIGPDWSDKKFWSDDIVVERTYGHTYPEGNATHIERVHICGECWEDKLVPWVEGQGGVVSKTKIDT